MNKAEPETVSEQCHGLGKWRMQRIMGSRQERAFLESEGDAYFQRNRDRLRAKPWLNTLWEMAWKRMPNSPSKILEIGCGHGDTLAFLHDTFGAECHGVDPSQKAVEEGRKAHPACDLRLATATKLPYGNLEFDCLIFGCCLYLCDRESLFRIAFEADRVLRPGGTILILDFLPPSPCSNPYHHHEGLYSYKMRYSDMFTWNPCYTLYEQYSTSHTNEFFHLEADERMAFSLLYKSEPDEPYPPTHGS